MAIEILPPQLANQIAAGEVVERPASVIKELVENSLDAGATRVDIDIDKGGSKLIRIRDNGSGIAKEQLALALSRHATSKLHSLDDLEAIMSFGFRGEALASISSVSRLTLTSRTAEQTEAWQAHAEGSDMAVKINPAAHPVGTTIEAVDLFFNTPARRRFLKSDKTEFTHIDEWLKRIAIVKPQIHFTLQHNGKTVRNYRPANTEIQYLQRLGQVSSRNFADNAIKIECEHNDLSLTGYIQSPNQIETNTNYLDIHYFYVNGRLVRDRLVNHAVRQAFAGLGEGSQPGYVLMLELDPHQVDVNVHPAKHEVRFHQGRYVHDYILQALQSALAQVGSLDYETAAPEEASDKAYRHTASSPFESPLQEKSALELASPASASIEEGSLTEPLYNNQLHKESRQDQVQGSNTGAQWRGKSEQDGQAIPAYGVSERLGRGGNTGYRDHLVQTSLPSQQAKSAYGELLTTPERHTSSNSEANWLKPMPSILAEDYWVITQGAQLSLLSISKVSYRVKQAEIVNKLSQGLVGQPLLMPVSVAADVDWQTSLQDQEQLLRQLGLELTIRYQQLIIKKVPPYLREAQLAIVIPELLQWLRFETPSQEALAAWLAKQSQMGFISPVDIWRGFCQLQESEREGLLALAVELPWQDWLQKEVVAAGDTCSDKD